MKRLAASAIAFALCALPLCAQRGGGAHGGSSGPHGGFSGSHGFSGSGGFSHGSVGGFRGSAPGRVTGPPPARFAGPPATRFAGPPMSRFAGPPHYVSNRMPYRGPGPRPIPPHTSGARPPYTRAAHVRMPYQGNHGADGHHDGYHHHDHDGHHHGYVSFYGWAGYPYLPWWGWGYPFLYDNWDDDDYDQPVSNYAANPYPYTDPGAYDQPLAPEQEEPASTPWPYSRPAPEPASAQPAPAPDAGVTLVFKDGRPNQQIHNYLLTTTTLSVLDHGRRDIPVAQIDVPATATLNRAAGIDFALPEFPR